MGLDLCEPHALFARLLRPLGQHPISLSFPRYLGCRIGYLQAPDGIEQQTEQESFVDIIELGNIDEPAVLNELLISPLSLLLPQQARLTANLGFDLCFLLMQLVEALA